MVEDDESIRELVAEVLEDDGIAVEQAPDGAAALRLARGQAPNLVVMDVTLPDLDGVAVAHQLRDICGPDLPILAMTADEQIGKRASDMDAYSLLEKPFELEHLLLAVRRGLLEYARQP